MGKTYKREFQDIQAKVTNSNKEKYANYFLGLKNAEWMLLFKVWYATKQLDILQREIQDAHEDSNNLETVLKDLTKEVQEFSREQRW